MSISITQQSKINPKVSIIVPVFNVEKYIEQCATSLFDQTYDNIEYIFVNDASTDNSLAVLTAVAKRYPNRKITITSNSQNLGSSATRNNGIDLATGEYITFCDSDDWTELTYIKEMVNIAVSSNADVVVTPFYTNTFNKQEILHYKDTDIANLNIIPINFQHMSLCNKLIKSHFIKENKSLHNIDCWEDLSVITRIYSQEPTVTLLNTPFYHYRKYEHHSLTSASHERQLNDRLRYADFLTKWFEERNLSKKYEQFLNHLQFTAKIKMLRTTPRQFRRWKNTYPQSNSRIISYTDIPLHYRIAFYIADILIPKAK